MKELSIFVDESGDFGKYAKHSPYYIVSIVAHDQSTPIDNEVAALEEQLSYLNYPNHCIHTGPIIRMEYEYLFEDIKVRRKLLFRMMAFIRRTNIQFKCFYIEKRHIFLRFFFHQLSPKGLHLLTTDYFKLQILFAP